MTYRYVYSVMHCTYMSIILIIMYTCLLSYTHTYIYAYIGYSSPRHRHTRGRPRHHVRLPFEPYRLPAQGREVRTSR